MHLWLLTMNVLKKNRSFSQRKSQNKKTNFVAPHIKSKNSLKTHFDDKFQASIA